MNENPTTVWSRPWKGWKGWVRWFGILFLASSVITAVLGLLTGFISPDRILVRPLLPAVALALVGTFVVGFAHWICCWRNFRRFLFGIVCLATLLALVYVVENIRGKLAWNHYVREVEARGDTLDVTKLIPPAVSNDQNFTLCPFLKPILDFEIVPVEGGGYLDNTIVWRDTNGLARLDAFNVDAYVEAHLRARSSAYGVSPIPGTMPSTGEQEGGNPAEQARRIKEGLPLFNGWVNLKGFESYLLLATNANDVGLTDSVPTNVLLLLRVFDPGLNQLETCAEQRSLDRWSIFYDTNDPPGILLPHLSRIKQICQLLQLRAAARLAAGQTAAAMKDLALAFRLAESPRDEPFLISHLVRIGALQIPVQLVREGLAQHRFSDAQLRELQQQFADVDLLTGAECAMKGERGWFGGAICEVARRDRRYLARVLGSDGPQSALLRLMPSGWLYQNQLVMCEWQDRYGLAPIDADNHRIHPPSANAADREFARMRGPYGFLGKLFLPALSKALLRLAEGQTTMDHGMIACALERYRMAKGQYPDQLQALAPDFLDHVPHDIVTGEPMIYRTLPDGRYILYSVGWDETDDGGALPSGKRYDPEGDEDWVWQLPDPRLQPY